MENQYGKFNSAEELLKGYNELEKSFTQKCQQLSALQTEAKSGTNVDTSPQNTEEVTTTVPVEPVVDATTENEKTSSQTLDVTNLQQYLDAHPELLREILQNNYSKVEPLPRVMTGGGNVSMALPSRPKTIKEASEMAKSLFK